MKTSRSTRQRRGYALIHMVAVISLLGVFLTVASRLTVECTQLWSALAEQESATARLEQVMRRIQRDAWSSATFRAPSSDRLVLTDADGHEITWIAERDHGVPALRRKTGDAPPATWRFTGSEPMTFEAADASVIMRRGQRTVTFISQVRLGQENER